jgi:hypothetical protein
MPLRVRRSVAVLCIALAVCTAFTPDLVPDSADALLTPVWQYEPPASVVVLPDADARCQEQSASLVRHTPLRAPPQHHLA